MPFINYQLLLTFTYKKMYAVPEAAATWLANLYCRQLHLHQQIYFVIASLGLPDC